MLRSTSGTAKGSTFTLALAAILVRGLKRAHRLFKNRMAVSRLGELDERGLKDIGLTPSDVRAALALPLGVDPSQHLCDVAGHKRSPGRSGDAVSVARLRASDADVTSKIVGACPPSPAFPV